MIAVIRKVIPPCVRVKIGVSRTKALDDASGVLGDRVPAVRRYLARWRVGWGGIESVEAAFGSRRREGHVRAPTDRGNYLEASGPTASGLTGARVGMETSELMNTLVRRGVAETIAAGKRLVAG